MGALKYIKHLIKNIKELIDNNTVIVGDFKTLLALMDRSSKQKINGNNGFECHTGPDRLNRYSQNIPS